MGVSTRPKNHGEGSNELTHQVGEDQGSKAQVGIGMRSSGSLRLGCSRNIYNQIKLLNLTSQKDDCVY